MNVCFLYALITELFGDNVRYDFDNFKFTYKTPEDKVATLLKYGSEENMAGQLVVRALHVQTLFTFRNSDAPTPYKY